MKTKTLMPMHEGDHALCIDTNLHRLHLEAMRYFKVTWGDQRGQGQSVLPWHAHYETMYSPKSRGSAMETGDISTFTFSSRKVNK